MLDIDNVDQNVQEQVMDLMDQDLENDNLIKEVVRRIENRETRTIMTSTGIGITKYKEEIKHEATSQKRLIHATKTHVSRTTQLINGQNNRGLM